MLDVPVALSFEWQVVCEAEGVEYAFPRPITPFMRREYRRPAIYRWRVTQADRPDDEVHYIGEAQQLCPQRLSGYLKPGPTQETNKRLQREFQSYLERGYTIQLDVLHLGQLSIGAYDLKLEDLASKSVRRFLEQLLITYYRQQGAKVLNL